MLSEDKKSRVSLTMPRMLVEDLKEEAHGNQTNLSAYITKLLHLRNQWTHVSEKDSKFRYPKTISLQKNAGKLERDKFSRERIYADRTKRIMGN